MISDASAASGGTQSWPAITEEDLPWHSRLPETAVSGRLRARHFGPYRAARCVDPTTRGQLGSGFPELNATAANALRAIDQAVTAGLLAEMTGYRRNRLWQATDVLTALDDFAARAGRRTVGGG